MFLVQPGRELLFNGAVATGFTRSLRLSEYLNLAPSILLTEPSDFSLPHLVLTSFSLSLHQSHSALPSMKPPLPHARRIQSRRPSHLRSSSAPPTNPLFTISHTFTYSISLPCLRVLEMRKHSPVKLLIFPRFLPLQFPRADVHAHCIVGFALF